MRKLATKRPPQRRKAAKPDWITRHAADPDEVRSFCRRHRLLKAGHWVIELLNQEVPWNDLRVAIEGDPEGDSEWIVFEFDMEGTVRTVLDAYHLMKTKWVENLSIPQLLLMRLSYNIL